MNQIYIDRLETSIFVEQLDGRFNTRKPQCVCDRSEEREDNQNPFWTSSYALVHRLSSVVQSDPGVWMFGWTGSRLGPPRKSYLLVIEN